MPQISWDLVNANENLPGAIPEVLQPHDAEPPKALELASAALRQNNIISSLYDLSNYKQPPPPTEGYTPYAPGEIAGFEQYADRFTRSGSPEETQRIKAQIGTEEADKHTIQAAGGWGLAASIAAGLTDPISLMTMVLPVAAPEAWGSRAARIALGVGANVAADTAQETALHQTQALRTMGESAMNIGAGAILSGILGGIATRVPKSEFDELRKALGAKLNQSPDSTAGAAAATDFTTLADETIATAPARAIANTVGQISPLNRLMTSPFKATRQLAQKLLEVPYLLNKNLKGIATPTSVESLVKDRVNRARYNLITDYEKAFVDYSQRVVGEGAKNLRSFGEEVVTALRNGDVSDIPEAQQLARTIRKTFDADREQLTKLGVLPEEFHVIGADSYFPRVYDTAAIAADTPGLEQRLRKWYTDNPRLPIGPSEAVSKIEGAPDESSKFFSEDAGTFAGVPAKSIVLRDRANQEIGRLVYVERGGDLQIARTQVAAAWKNQKLGQRMVMEAIDEAERSGKNIKSDQVVTADQLKVYWALRKRGYGIEFADENAVKKAIADGTELSVPGGVVRSMQSPQIILKVLEQEHKVAKAALKAAKKDATAGKVGKKDSRLAFDRAMRRAEKIDARLREATTESAAESTPKLTSHIERMQSRLEHTEERISELKRQALAADAEFERLTGLRRDALKTARASGRSVQAQREHAAQAERTAASAHKLNEKAAEPVFREKGEIESAVQETINNMLGTVRGMADLGGATTPGARPLRGRTLDVPDNILAPYLSNDLEHVMTGYHRAMVPQIEMRKAFGSASLNSEMENITNGVNAAIARTESSAEKTKLRERLSKDINNIVAMRDRVLGQTGPRGNMPAWLVKANRIVRAYNYVRLLGAQALSSLSDYGHVISRYGLVRTGAMTAKFLTNVSANKIMRTDAKRLGTALEWVIDTRGSTLGEIGDELAGSKAERYAQWASRGFSRISGMATWNSSLKAITAALEQDAILRAVRNPEALNTFKRAKLAAAGIDEDMLRRISGQYAKFGEETDGLHRARTDLWDDEEAARTIEGAVVKAADQMIVTRGLGDIPVLMNNELVKTLLQFKSFGMSSVNRITIPLAQGLAHGDVATANGLGMMLTLGALTYAAKEWAAGREPDMSPRRVISEALNWSGALGYLPDVYDPIAGAFNMPRLSRYTDRMPIESLLGPTYGTATSLYNTLSNVSGAAEGAAFRAAGHPELAPKNALGVFDQADLHKLRQMLPLQNLFYLRRAVNALEGETGSALGLQGATNEPFVDRITETKPPDKSK